MASLSTRRNAAQQIVLPTTADGGEALSKNFAWIDAVQGGVKDRTDAPPGSPSEGDLYILTGTPTGAWSAQAANDVAMYYNSGWSFFTPPSGEAGLRLYVIDETQDYRWDGSAWVVVPSGGNYIDGEKIILGTGDDASIMFDGSDLIINSENITALDEVHFTNFEKYTFDKEIVTGGGATGQSTITSGLVVNDGGGGTANNDFRVETTSEANALVVDASADEIQTNVPIVMGDGAEESLKFPYLAAAPSTLVNGMVWMESDGLHIYYGGVEKVVAGV
jgi:hypothetical protein